jgi:hypothetical protein
MSINLISAWIGLTLGFLGGGVMGMFFRDERWLGGYGSFKRRLYRLAHISFFGLGFVNLAFALTARSLPLTHTLETASIAFVVGAISMPICALILAHQPRALPIFAVPVGSLLLGGSLTVAQLLKSLAR